MDELNVESVRKDWDELISEMKSDPNRTHFKKTEDWDNIDFESFLISQGIKGVPCAAKNQQSNAIPEQVHDAIKTLL